MISARLNSSPRHRVDRAAFLTSKRLFQLTLLALILLAWGLRLHRLDAQSLWYDEGVTANLAQRTLIDLTRWTARDIQPPLYYYAVWGWGRVAGWSEWSLRFVSVWWGALAVPLLALLAYRLTQRQLVALVAALLTALHPLLLYYSQEARMYTMLVTLGLGAGYLLLRLSETASPLWRQWGIYALVATAAVYTHYFAFFLLLGLGIAFLIHHFVRQPFGAALRDRRLAGFFITHLAVTLVYLAWMGALFRQLTTDASYWQGRLKVWEAFRTIALRFIQGETVAEQAAFPGLLLYAGVTLLLLLTLGWQARRQHPTRRTLLYALCWLAFPIGGVLGLAAFVPKFNARYVLLALPGLLLVWSAGLVALYPSAAWAVKKAPFLHLVRQVSSVLLLFLLLAGFQEANRNWFTDPAFTKAQWREMAAYLRDHRESDEAILLVSGHAWPIWDYYAPDLPAIRLPDLEILDVNAVLDFANTGAVLQAALQDKQGVWLINWQDEVVDPNGVAVRQLLSAATEMPVKAEFWQLRLRHFVDLLPTAIQTTPPIDVVLEANFGDQIRLQGYTVTPEGDLLLFWQLGSAPSTPLPDLHINLRTETTAGLLYADPADRRPADYNFPVMRWQPGQTVMGRIPADVWAGAGALPGRYQIQLGVYDPAGDPAGLDLLDPAGNRIGKFVRLTLDLPLATPGEAQPTVAAAELLPGLKVAFVADVAAAEPGQVVAVTLHWLLEQPFVMAPDLRWQWRNGEETTVVASDTRSIAEDISMQSWPVGQWLRQVIAIAPPVAFAPGSYVLEVVTKAGDRSTARLPFTVLPSSRNFTAPPLAVVTEENFSQTGDDAPAQVRLLGLATAIPPTMTVNAQLTLDLVWQSIAPTTPAADYVVTLQLLGPDGRPVAQADQPLPGGSTSWLTGQVERQSLTLAAPPAPGRYSLILALYHATQTGFPRLVTSTGDDFVELDVIAVTR